MSSHDPLVVLAKVDANEEANKELASQYEIRGFPTIKILRNGGKTIQEYKGPREADGIVEYLKKQSGPASAEIKSAEDASSFIGEKKVVIVSSALINLLVVVSLLQVVSSFIVNIYAYACRLVCFQISLERSLRTTRLLLRNCVLIMSLVTLKMPSSFHVGSHQ